jgi:hypothetical protein
MVFHERDRSTNQGVCEQFPEAAPDDGDAGAVVRGLTDFGGQGRSKPVGSIEKCSDS